MEWLAENLLVDALKAQLPEEVLLANPIVYTLDQGRSGAIPAPSARELRRSLALVGLLVPNR